MITYSNNNNKMNKPQYSTTATHKEVTCCVTGKNNKRETTTILSQQINNNNTNNNNNNAQQETIVKTITEQLQQQSTMMSCSNNNNKFQSLRIETFHSEHKHVPSCCDKVSTTDCEDEGVSTPTIVESLSSRISLLISPPSGNNCFSPSNPYTPPVTQRRVFPQPKSLLPTPATSPCSNAHQSTMFWFSKEEPEHVSRIMSEYLRLLHVEKGRAANSREPKKYIGRVKRMCINNETQMRLFAQILAQQEQQEPHQDAEFNQSSSSDYDDEEEYDDDDEGEGEEESWHNCGTNDDDEDDEEDEDEENYEEQDCDDCDDDDYESFAQQNKKPKQEDIMIQMMDSETILKHLDDETCSLLLNELYTLDEITVYKQDLIPYGGSLPSVTRMYCVTSWTFDGLPLCVHSILKPQVNQLLSARLGEEHCCPGISFLFCLPIFNQSGSFSFFSSGRDQQVTYADPQCCFLANSTCQKTQNMFDVRHSDSAYHACRKHLLGDLGTEHDDENDRENNHSNNVSRLPSPSKVHSPREDEVEISDLKRRSGANASTASSVDYLSDLLSPASPNPCSLGGFDFRSIHDEDEEEDEEEEDDKEGHAHVRKHYYDSDDEDDDDSDYEEGDSEQEDEEEDSREEYTDDESSSDEESDESDDDEEEEQGSRRNAHYFKARIN